MQPKGGKQRLMIYCHDSVGIGHLRRSLAICQQVSDRFPTASFLLATGTPHIALFETPPRLDYIKLLALCKREDGVYHSKCLDMSLAQLIECRQALLTTTMDHYRPDVLLVDKAPLGVCRELVPALEWLRTHRPQTRIVFGMRDIEDSPEATRAEWRENGVYDALENLFTEIWVYGMQSIFDVSREYEFSDRICDKLRYMGYVKKASCGHEPVVQRDGRPTVLVTVGGGTDGERLLRMYQSAAAQRVSQAGHRTVLVGGPDLPTAVAAKLKRVAHRLPDTEWIGFEPCMQCRMASADLIVTMGGFNTLCELVTLGKPALVLPRTTPRMEQSIRASRWEQLGLLRTMEAESATPQSLADRIVTMLGDAQKPNPSLLDMGALDRIPDRLASLWNGACTHETALRV